MNKKFRWNPEIQKSRWYPLPKNPPVNAQTQRHLLTSSPEVPTSPGSAFSPGEPWKSENKSFNLFSLSPSNALTSLPSVTCSGMNVSRNIFVAAIVARSRSRFYRYFVQRWLQQKRCEACSFRGMSHQAKIRTTCVRTAQRNRETICKKNCHSNNRNLKFPRTRSPKNSTFQIKLVENLPPLRW